MLKLKELYLKGIGRFVEEQVIHFDILGNLVQVDGQNNNTGGSSGSGKSTVFNALDYLLGLNDIPNTVLKSRLTDEGIFVKGIFEYEGRSLVISRSKKLSIEMDGETISGSAKITEEKLDSILGMPRDLFRKILHKRQKEGGFFLNMPPREMNEFLMNCLGLSHFKSKVENIDKKITELTKIKEQLINQLDSSNAAISATKSAIISLGSPPVKEVGQSLILQLKEKMENSISQLSNTLEVQRKDMVEVEKNRPKLDNQLFDISARKSYEQELEHVNKQINKIISDERDRQEKVRSQISSLNMESTSLNFKVQSGKNAQNDAAKTAIEIKKIRESICPTCEQNWFTDSAKTTELSLIEKLKNFKELISIGKESSDRIAMIASEIEYASQLLVSKAIEGKDILESREKELSLSIKKEFDKEREFQERQHYLNNKNLEYFSDQQNVAKNRYLPIIDQARGQVDLDRRSFDMAVSKLKSYEDSKARYDNSFQKLKNQEEEFASKLGNITSKLGNTESELLVAEELKRGIKSYLSCSFDDALQSIGDNATKLIRNIANMANATVQLEGTRETQEGKIKEEVNAVIHMDGEESIDIRSLSGGERTSADLAIDLSVIDLIEHRNNVGINIYVLDESFDGLDSISVEMALEMLKNSNINKKLIIVAHNPEVKEMVESRLTVVRDGAISRVVQS